MTDNKEDTNKPKKLTLSSSKLTLNKSITPALGRSFVSGRSNTVTVEVKKGVASTTATLTRKLTASEEDLNLSSDEVSKRLSLLKKAAEINKAKEQELVFKTEQAKIALEQKNETIASQVNLEVNNVEKQKSDEVTTIVAEPKLTVSPIKPNTVAPLKVHSAKAGEVVDEEAESKKALDAKVPVKLKKEEPKKLRKNEIFHMLESDEDTPGKPRSLASIKRAREKERRKFFENKSTEKLYREVIIPEVITVSELASRMSERVADVIKELMKMGMIATANQAIDPDTAELIVTTMGHTPKRVQESDVENIFDIPTDNETDLEPRAPVVTIMGHVDHGKTSLLDALKSTDVAGGEAGGITQHIGAYRVTLPSGQSITFLDTPGHEAFTEMRSRGAKVTDIVVLVVAADDGIMPQTIEAINHAKAAEVPIIVAVNKMDKPDANLERVRNELLMHELVPEELGGDIIVVPVSALKKQNLDKLEEAILLVAEMKELTATSNAIASGAVIESKVDKGRGVVTTILVQRGRLKVGDLVVAGESYGKVKRMLDDHGKNVEIAMPSMPVEIQGLNQAPMAGEKFVVVQSEKHARDFTEYRARKALEKRTVASQHTSSLEELFLRASGNSGIKSLPLIIKGDVQGSIEAIVGSLGKIISDEVKIKILHTAVGGITESDVALASASNAMIIGFNVRGSNNATIAADKAGVDLRYYSIIYHLIDDVKSIMSGMLSPIIREVYIGSVEIRQVFNITKVGKVAGSYVTKGIIKRGAGVRLLRDNIVIHEGKLKTLKRFKEDVKEVKENYECGIAFENYEDIRVGDTVEVFEIVEEQQKL